MRVGEVSTETGQSVRAIHYYDQQGLVRPTLRTSGGHRLYSREDVQRLCAVGLLRVAGMATAEIRQHLNAGELNLAAVIEDQLGKLDSQLTALGTLRQRLAEVVSAGAALDSGALSKAHQAVLSPYQAQKAVALLFYDDVLAARDWLGQVFQLAAGVSTSDDSGTYACVVTSQGLVHLHRATKDLRPPSDSGVCSSMVVVTVDNVDQLAERITSMGARVTYGPSDMPYGVREVGAADLAGHLWCFHSPLQTKKGSL
jgi:DNA-binding transcriptional MerR regulator/predicted enzyme related to lactoylglutathione lyase